MVQRLLQVKVNADVAAGDTGFEWSSSYLLRLERLPNSHISPSLAHMILFTGKAILLLQQSQSYQQMVKKEEPLVQPGSSSMRGSVFHYLSQGSTSYSSATVTREREAATESEGEEESDEDEEDDSSKEEGRKGKSDDSFQSDHKKSSEAAPFLLLGFQSEEIEYLDQEFHALLQSSTTTTATTGSSTRSSSSQQFIPKLELLIHQIYNCISNRLWQYMKQEYGFLSYLQIIRNTYLLGKGELFQNILDELYPLTFASSSSVAAAVTGPNQTSNKNKKAMMNTTATPSVEAMDEVLNWQILRNATKLIALDEDEMLYRLQLKIDLSKILIVKFTEQNLYYFQWNGHCLIEYPHSLSSTLSSSHQKQSMPPGQSALGGVTENLYEPMNLLFNVQPSVSLSNVFLKLWAEKNQLQSIYLYNTINNPWNPVHAQSFNPPTAAEASASGPAKLAMDPIYLNGSLWFQDTKFIQKGFSYAMVFSPAWINVNRHVTLHHPYFQSTYVQDRQYWPKWSLSESEKMMKYSHLSVYPGPYQILDHRTKDLLLGSIAIGLQNDPRTIHTVGKGELSRDIQNSLLIGVSFHGKEIEERCIIDKYNFF